MLVPKLLLTPMKIRIFGPKTAKFGPKYSFWAKYCPFLHILSNAQPKTNVNKVPRLVFCYVGNKTYDFSSKKKKIPKTTKFGPKLAFFWSIRARPCRLIQCPVGWSVGGCGARAVSRKTPIYFIYLLTMLKYTCFCS